MIINFLESINRLSVKPFQEAEAGSFLKKNKKRDPLN